MKSPAIKSMDMSSFDYTCGTTVKMLDIDTAEAGDAAARFKDYTRTANRDLIERAFNGTDFLKGIPAPARDLYADIPDKFTCAGSVPVKKEAVSRSAGYLGSLIAAFYLIYRGI